ncbi:MAG: hypothetical protein ABFS24_08825 [Pseudomonadota bacterium]
MAQKMNLLSVPRSAMFRDKHTHRKLDPLMLLAIFVSLGVLMTSAVAAAEPFYNTLSLANLQDQEVRLTPVGKHGAGLHMSYQTNPYRYEPLKFNRTNVQQTVSSPTFFLSVRVPW